MVYYYLDIETYGKGPSPDPKSDGIITALLCAIDASNGKRLQEPLLLKSWESSEKEVVEHLSSRMIGKDVWDFVPVGFNILFDLWFLRHKFKKYLSLDMGDRFYLDRPFIDLKHVAVIANSGRFKGVALSGKGDKIKEWYEAGEYHKIERHTLEKLDRFTQAYGVWAQKLK